MVQLKTFYDGHSIKRKITEQNIMSKNISNKKNIKLSSRWDNDKITKIKQHNFAINLCRRLLKNIILSLKY